MVDVKTISGVFTGAYASILLPKEPVLIGIMFWQVMEQGAVMVVLAETKEIMLLLISLKLKVECRK
jgi:hypothetical protein